MSNLILSGVAGNGVASYLWIIAYIAVFGVIMFLMMRPQKKEQKRLEALISTAAPGDSVLTNSGFYGVIIDVTDDTVIVEFGNNKNCRIPMKKNCIAQLEKPEDAVQE